jgi:hypothetical protein
MVMAVMVGPCRHGDVHLTLPTSGRYGYFLGGRTLGYTEIFPDNLSNDHAEQINPISLYFYFSGKLSAL